MAKTFVPERGPDGKILVDPPITITEMLPTMPSEMQSDGPETVRHPTSRRELAIYAVALVLVALVAGTVLARWTMPATATPSVVATMPAVQPTTVPTVQPTAAAILDRAIVAYAAPDGDILGAVDAGRSYTAIARYGSSWAQLDIGERAPVWVRLGDLPGVAVAGLPDLAPKPTAIPVPMVPAAPVSVPNVPAAADCTETSATFRASQRVEKNGILVGEVAAWSCLSQADADQELARRAAELTR